MVCAGRRDAYRAFVYTIRQPATPSGLNLHLKLSKVREPRLYRVRRVDRRGEGCLVGKGVWAEPHQRQQEHVHVELAVCAAGDHPPTASTGAAVRLQVLSATRNEADDSSS